MSIFSDHELGYMDDFEYQHECRRMNRAETVEDTETWDGFHGQITAPKGTFDRIYEEANDIDFDI